MKSTTERSRPRSGGSSPPGLLELTENAMPTGEEREPIFDLGTYIAGSTGLCQKPLAEQSGPFGCSSIASCMEQFRRPPRRTGVWPAKRVKREICEARAERRTKRISI